MTRIHALLLASSSSSGIAVTFLSETHELAHTHTATPKHSTGDLVINQEGGILQTNTISFPSIEKSHAF